MGLLGGSFDPPHFGHLHVARSAHDALGLEEVRLIPAAQPPHKRGRVLAPDEDRVAMLDLLAALEPWLKVDRCELDRGGTSFTHDTLVRLREQLRGRDVELFFLLGSDSLVDLPTWHRADELVGLATIVTIARDRASVEMGLSQLDSKLPHAAESIRAHVLEVEPLPISSTQIRARVRAGQPIEELVPRSIAQFIARRGLYRDEFTAQR